MSEHSTIGISSKPKTKHWPDTCDSEAPCHTFSISSLQILDEHGNLDESRMPDVSSEDLVKLYRAMVLARLVDDRTLKLQRQGRIGTVPLCTGHEAVTCGATLAMRDEDWFIGSYRDLGGRLMRGEPIENGLLYYNGHEEGAVFPGGERTLPISIIIAAQCLHAVGVAYAMRMKGETETAVVCFLGDGGTSEGDFHEAMNFASVWQVPVVFVVANNQWAISVPREKQMHSRTIAQKAIAYDMPGIQVDGNDALAVYKATKDALDLARSGGGPTLIEAVTYRMLMHTTADDPTRYQPPEDLEIWAKRDPITRFRKFIEQKDLWDDEQQTDLEAQCKQKIEAAVAAFESRTDFKVDSPFDHVFGTSHTRIEQQRAEFLDMLKKESADG
ncbi:MAG: pyruvate dehydrogenase (acetyl-transferring) E1 component subunit alpha [Phycisphaerales bacterium]|nr:pyruvate dehydrogenase (acetyl-transferring) E1 component subunit alpha [Phycisphaerales bacterium]